MLRYIIYVLLFQMNLGNSKAVVVPDFLEDFVVKSLVFVTFDDFACFSVILNLYQNF